MRYSAEPLMVLSLVVWLLPSIEVSVSVYNTEYFDMIRRRSTKIHNDNDSDRGSDTDSTVPCPHNCASCSYDIKNNTRTYNCSSVLVQMDYRLKTVTIDCGGSLLDCTNLPEGIAAAGQISYVELERCSINSTLQCVLPALSASGNFSSLSMKELQTPLYKEMFSGLGMVKKVFIYDYGLGKVWNHTNMLSVETFQYTPLLTFLGIFRSPYELILHEEIISPLTHIKEIYVYKIKKLVLGPKALSNLSSLWHVSLKESNLTELPEDVFFGSDAITYLDLSDNELRYLPDAVFSNLKKLLRLRIVNNKLETITREMFASLDEVKRICLDGNRIKTLPDSLFSSRYLQVLSFASNRIENVTASTFVGSSTLTNLDLSNNLLSWNCWNKTLKKSRESVLVNLDRLKVLDLSNNRIKSVCADWRHVSEVLDLSYNRLESLAKDDLTFRSYDVRVNFENNDIATVFPPTLSPFSRVLFKLDYNPFNCDCRLYSLLKIQQDILDYMGTGGLLLKNHYDLTHAQCSQPQSLKNVSLLEITDDVRLDSVTCSVDGSESCECLFRPNKDRIECKCEDTRNLTLPKSPFGNTTAVKIKLLKSQPDLAGLPSSVTALDMSGLQLRSIPNIPSTIKEIDLRNNSLQMIQPDIMNTRLLLENNPLQCDCAGMDNVINLQRYQRNILNYSELLCADGFIVKGKDPNTLCDVYYSTVIGVSCVVGVVVLVITVVLMYIYMPEVQVMFFHIGLKCIVKEEWIDRGKIYDIFLSYSVKDECFVGDILLPKLEEMKYKVCEHTRDWEIGLPIPEQIYTSVANSKKTLFVVSEHFLKSVWVLEEFNATILQGAKDRKSRAVVILVEDVNLDEAPITIKHHLALNTCIKWDPKDKSFWTRLQNALPKKLTAEEIKKRQKAVKAVKSLGTGRSIVLNEDGMLVNTELLQSAPTAPAPAMATPEIMYLETIQRNT